MCDDANDERYFKRGNIIRMRTKTLSGWKTEPLGQINEKIRYYISDTMRGIAVSDECPTGNVDATVKVFWFTGPYRRSTTIEDVRDLIKVTKEGRHLPCCHCYNGCSVRNG